MINGQMKGVLAAGRLVREEDGWKKGGMRVRRMDGWLRWWQLAMDPASVLTARAPPWLPLCPASVYFATC